MLYGFTGMATFEATVLVLEGAAGEGVLVFVLGVTPTLPFGCVLACV